MTPAPVQRTSLQVRSSFLCLVFKLRIISLWRSADLLFSCITRSQQPEYPHSHLSALYMQCTQLFRDCMRLVRHIAPGNSPKGVALKTMVRSEFKKSMHEKDEAKIEVLKAGAIRALSNYMLYESGAKDEKLQGAMKRQSDDAVGDLKSSKRKAIGASGAEENDKR